MSETKLYYTPPKQEYFEELKSKAIEIWETYDNTYGYADDKVGRIKDIKNIEDNFMYMVAMFDPSNQQILANKLSEGARFAVKLRMVDGGQDPQFIYF